MSAVSAMDLLQRGVDQAAAAAWNGSGEFWVTTDLHRANWFAAVASRQPAGGTV